MADKKVSILSDFPKVTKEQWEKVIEKDLKGADYDKKLVWKTIDGFKVQPYYVEEDLSSIGHLDTQPGEFPFVRGTNTSNTWSARQDLFVDSPLVANEEAVSLLSKGVKCIGFHYKLPLTPKDLNELLKDIDLSKTEIVFVGNNISSLIKIFVDKVIRDGYKKEVINAAFSYDPIIGNLTLEGSFMKNSATINTSTAIIKDSILLTKDFPNIRVISVNAAVFENSGSTISQELAFAMSVGSDYLATLTALGLDPNLVAKKMRFNFSISSSYFTEIAKLRAAKMLWANITKEYGVTDKESQKIFINATTLVHTQTLYDPHINILRATSQAMSAVIAGIDTLVVIPFDYLYAPANDFSLRIARNIQNLLREESYMDKVVDVSGGSYYIETLTDSVSKKAWEIFQALEKNGGYTASFKLGKVQELISDIVLVREQNIATRKEILLGTNQYPNYDEVLPITIQKSLTLKQTDVTIKLDPKPITRYRAGREFEALRMKADHSNKNPLAFMLPIGDLAFRRARAQFSSNFFACGGYRISDHNGYNSIEEGVKEAMGKSASIIVLCSSDAEYLTYAKELILALHGRAIIVIAGEPASKEDLLTLGITNFISVKSNVLDTLAEYHKTLCIH